MNLLAASAPPALRSEGAALLRQEQVAVGGPRAGSRCPCYRQDRLSQISFRPGLFMGESFPAVTNSLKLNLFLLEETPPQGHVGVNFRRPLVGGSF